jgi:hypothetical protein
MGHGEGGREGMACEEVREDVLLNMDISLCCTRLLPRYPSYAS